MRDWIAGFVGENMATGAMLVVVTAAIVLAFLALFAIFKGFSGTGIRNNKRTRQARLAVMDAAIVDSRRRLVLVRRDDIEHLILIGGPTDVVVEQNIARSGNSALVKPNPRSKKTAPVAQSIPAATPAAKDEATAAIRPVPVTPTTASSRSPSGERPIQVSSPRIRPAAKPPAPITSAAPIKLKEPAAQVNPAEPARVVPTMATPPVQRAARPIQPAAPVTAPSTTIVTSPVLASSRSKSSPAPASASAATIAVAAVTTTVAPPSPPVESVPPEPVHSTVDNAENQLTDFEDNLAMNLGETLVKEEPSTDKSNLADEMDELLSEITSGAQR